MHVTYGSKKTIKVRRAYYYIVCLFCVNTIIAETELFNSFVFSIVNYIVYMSLFFISFASDIRCFKIRTIGYKALVLLLGCLSVYTSASNYILISILFILASAKIDIYSVIKVYLYTNTILISFIILISSIGLIGSQTAITYRNGLYVIRKSLGFNHVNVLANHIILVLLSIIYLYYKELKMKLYFLLLIILLFGYYTTQTNTLLVMGISGILILSLFRLMREKRFYNWKYIFAFCPMFCLGLSFAPIFAFSDRQNNILNTLLSNRVYYIKLFYEQYGISLFGQRINLIGSSEALASHVAARILDNAYLHMAIRYGIFILFVFVIGYLKIAINAVKRQQDEVLIIIFLISIWGVAETTYFRFDYNPFVLLIAYSYLGNNIFDDQGNRFKSQINSYVSKQIMSV